MDRTEYEADTLAVTIIMAIVCHTGADYRRGHRIWNRIIENRTLRRARDGIVGLDYQHMPRSLSRNTPAYSKILAQYS